MLIVKPFHSNRGCLSYIVHDDMKKDAVIIDPSEEIDLPLYLAYLSHHELSLTHILETHTHADHISSARALREKTGAKIAMHRSAPLPSKDISLTHEDTIAIGREHLVVKETRGHTNDSITFVAPGMVFTGDTLLLGGTGRTDFQHGDSESLYHSVWDITLTLPQETLIYPGHDYSKRISDTIKNTRNKNPRLQWCKQEFVEFMDAYHPPKPELFEEAITKNSH